MPTFTPTKQDGATARAGEFVYVAPGQDAPVDGLAPMLDEAGLNGTFIVDLLSAMLCHERCGAHLYRAVSARSLNPVLQRGYLQFGEQTEEHVEILEALMRSCGSDPMYVSPMGRAVEGMDQRLVESTYLLSGSADVMVQEMAMLDAVLLAETMCHDNWKMLRELSGALPAGPVRDAVVDAVDRVEDQEDEHRDWARQKKMQMTMLQARNPVAAGATATMEAVLDRVRSWFS